MSRMYCSVWETAAVGRLASRAIFSGAAPYLGVNEGNKWRKSARHSELLQEKMKTLKKGLVCMGKNACSLRKTTLLIRFGRCSKEYQKNIWYYLLKHVSPRILSSSRIVCGSPACLTLTIRHPRPAISHQHETTAFLFQCQQNTLHMCVPGVARLFWF